ncbi:MAG TPA: efflux RND transporter permease subunit [Dinghuibacter sp.]|uniref:efflux RND transporter permease subunit n=1 Tax=Dinghuibacter sp. TaxID=2024697 RepID=UPI002CEA7A2B|nr:efflux RND transporter permease subunit [Dinghuibacter sp.]HTJ11292.1 efflux RND transporter permease subunit [Dinghuibacter sp.]
MNISELSLKRPVLATVMNIMIVLFGVVGYTFLAVRDYPNIDPPVITVQTSYTGANADVIENQVTEPLEKQISGVPGIKTISSSSTLGASNITIEFNLGVNLEAAASDVRDKVSQAGYSLPKDIDAPPVVSKADANSDFILLLAVQSRTKGIMELSQYAENVLQQNLQTINDVSSVFIFGDKTYAMRIWLNPDKMRAYNVSFTDVNNAINNENSDLPPGKVYGNHTEVIIRSLVRLTTEDQFRKVIIRQDSAGIIRLGDVARVEIGPQVEEQTWKLNGGYGIGLVVTPQPGANIIAIADEFKKRVAQIEKSASTQDIQLKLLVDNTLIIKHSLDEVKETLLIAFALVVLVIFFFFRNWLIALRPLIDIPISLIATFFIMYVAGFTINILTLLGIVLATGLVVDDGIVVTENIFRKLEDGLPIRKAALEGSKEIFFAVISTSITLAIVFLPVIFLSGFVGSLFREFGVVVAAAVLISAFVSLTITPVLNVYLTGKNSGHGKFYERTEPFFRGIEEGYRRLLTAFMKVRWMAFVLIAICGVMIWYAGANLQSEIAPIEDRGNIRSSMIGPEGTSFSAMAAICDQYTNYLVDSVPERKFAYFSLPGGGSSATNTANGRLGLVDATDRTRSQDDIAKDLQRRVSRFNGARIFIIQEQTIAVGSSSRTGLPVQFVLQNLDLDKLREAVPRFIAEAQKDKTFNNVDVNLKFNKPEVQLSIDRIKEKDLGLSSADVLSAVQSAYAGGRLAYFIMDGEQYYVITQVERGSRDQPADITNLYVRNSRGSPIPLSAVVHLEESSSPSTLYHFNRFKSATISASLAEGKTIGDGVKAMQSIASKVLDNTFQTSLYGPSRDYAESSSNTSFAFILALVLIYLVLSAQFESFLDPFTIMLTVPLALAGALMSLLVFHQTLNIFSEIGMIMLVGLVTKNGILIVEFANQKRELASMSKKDGVIEASTQRLRPILMTSLATSLGALPIALSLGAASTSRVPLGVVVVGGVLFSLVLTLFVIPAVYTYISSEHKGHKTVVTE